MNLNRMIRNPIRIGLCSPLPECFFDLDGLDVIGKLLRYEAAAKRSYYRAFHTLERLQAKRMGKDVSPPQVMHVHGSE